MNRPPIDRLRDFTTDRRLMALLPMAVVVGTGGAIAAWALFHLINLATNLAYYGRPSTAPASIIGNALGPAAALVPVAGCLVIGLMARYGSERIRGHGIPEAIEAILIGRSRMQAKVAVLKPLSSAISIGTGGPFGAEGPIIMTGGAFGSLFAQLFDLSNVERKTLLVAGAAAGMTATFGTPVAAILLAVELLLFEWKPRSFVPVAVASVVAAAWRPVLLTSSTLFPMAMSLPLPVHALLFAAALGIGAGLASGLLTQMVYFSEDLFQRLPIHWMWWPALGGLVVGIGGLVEPHALGVGYDNIAQLLQGQMAVSAAVSLLLVKALIWSVALGSGTSGGVLAPLLMMGGALGAISGQAVMGSEAGLWALVGMAAMMGGTMRSPLTAIVFAVEITQNVGALLPLAVACTAAHATTVLLLRRSILTEKLARRGHHVMREYGVDPFESTRVLQVMTRAVVSLPGTAAIGPLAQHLRTGDAAAAHRAYPVVDGAGQVVGMVSRSQVLRWSEDAALQGRPLGELTAGAPVIAGFEDELVGQIADRMAAARVSRVPIVQRSDGTLVGLVTRQDLLRVREETRRHESERERLIRIGRVRRA